MPGAVVKCVGVVMLLVIATTGCATLESNPKTSIGSLGGAAFGGLMAAEAQQKALESAPAGRPVAWTNPDSGHQGTVTPVRTYQSGDTYCREFQSDVVIGGKNEKAYGTACRQPDGSWKVQG
jgi:surface antigen